MNGKLMVTGRKLIIKKLYKQFTLITAECNVFAGFDIT